MRFSAASADRAKRLAISVAAVASVGTLSACGRDPAPVGVDDATAFGYQNFQTADDTTLAEVTFNIHNEFDLGSLAVDDNIKRTVGTLPQEAIAGLFPREVDVSKTQGTIVVTVIQCPLTEVEKIHIALNQDELHPGYDAYDRQYTSSDADYLSRTTDRLTWETNYTISQVGSTYDARVLGEARFLDDIDASIAPFSPVFMTRSYLPEAGVFSAGGDSSAFNQDYQFDFFYERAPNETVHVYSLWREMNFGEFDQGNDLVITLITDRSVEGDKETEAACQARLQNQ